jgi:hypothetical protein
LNIKGRIVPPTNLAYFECQAQGTEPPFSIPTTFIADTGSTRTAILYKDASLIPNLNYDQLEGGFSVSGIGGKVNVYWLKGITITFPTSDPANHQETIERAIVFRDFSRSEEERRDLFKIPSVIGMDILRKYNITFQGNEAILYD